MGRTLVERMGRGDVATNLGATTLVTNAYLFGGEAKYRDWVVEYTESWMERTGGTAASSPTTSACRGRSGSTSTASGGAATTAGPGPTAGT